MNTSLYIPQTLKIGFQKRADTFTGKLAYIIYYDDKKKLRKETSWNGWRDQTIDTMEIPNVPTDGFTMNKGFTRYSDWGSGRAVIRMWDQRDFEFEIGLDNLVGILMHSDVSKREIGEKCVFAWKGTELVLLPTNTEEYQASVKYTQKQGNKVSAKDLVPGYTYIPKKESIPHIYLGRFVQHKDEGSWYNHEPKKQVVGEKKHWFQPTLQPYEGCTGVLQAVAKEPSSFLSHVDAEEIHADYPSYLDALHSTPIVQKIVGYNEKIWECANKSRYGRYLNINPFYVKVSEGIYIKFEVDNDSSYNQTTKEYGYNIKVDAHSVISITNDGCIDVDYLERDRYYGYSYSQASAKRVSVFGVTLNSADVLAIRKSVESKFEYPVWWKQDVTDVGDSLIDSLDTYIKEHIMVIVPNAVDLCWVLENGNVTKGLEYGY
jgi:hypothetical protein